MYLFSIGVAVLSIHNYFQSVKLAKASISQAQYEFKMNVSDTATEDEKF